MPVAQYPVFVPEPVRKAKQAAIDVGFPLVGGSGPSACTDRFGQLLTVLAAMNPGGHIGEIGTGVGVGTAWLAEGAQDGATIVSVEIDEALVKVAREVFSDRSDITILCGDWRTTLGAEGPFDLLFCDGGYRAELALGSRHTLFDLVRPGGVIVMDDVTPEELWPEEWIGQVDDKREAVLRDERVFGAELRVSQAEGGLICVVRCR